MMSIYVRLTIFLILFTNCLFAQNNILKAEFNGVSIVEQVGSCKITDGVTNVYFVMTLDNTTGKVTAKEYWWKEKKGVYEERTSAKWTGHVLNPRAIRLEREIEYTCGNEKWTETLRFIAVFKNCVGKICDLVMEETYAMCPKSNCIFKVTYDLKTKL